MKTIIFTLHALERMSRYGITREEVINALFNPDEIVHGYRGRLIAHKYIGRYVLRIIYEKQDNVIVVVTVYRARRERYERKTRDQV